MPLVLNARLAKKLSTLAVALVPVMGGCAARVPAQLLSETPATRPAGDAVAVAELFTSEGCSSCPPADAVAADLAAAAARGGRAVYVLAFHVDYWNDLGWVDPLATADASRRQQWYAAARRDDGVYTPEMIVNGTASFVGSDRKRAAGAVAAALQIPTKTGVSLTAAGAAGQTLTVDYAVSPAPASAVLNVAAVEREHADDVPRGENAGRRLRHVNVVRAFRTIPLTGATATAGTTSLTLPAGVRAADVLVIAYAQETSSMAVIGATQIAPGSRPGPATRPAPR